MSKQTEILHRQSLTYLKENVCHLDLETSLSEFNIALELRQSAYTLPAPE